MDPVVLTVIGTGIALFAANWRVQAGWFAMMDKRFEAVGHPQELIISRHSSTDPVDDDAVAGRRHGWGLSGDGVCAAAG